MVSSGTSYSCIESLDNTKHLTTNFTEQQWRGSGFLRHFEPGCSRSLNRCRRCLLSWLYTRLESIYTCLRTPLWRCPTPWFCPLWSIESVTTHYVAVGRSKSLWLRSFSSTSLTTGHLLLFPRLCHSTIQVITQKSLVEPATSVELAEGLRFCSEDRSDHV